MTWKKIQDYADIKSGAIMSILFFYMLGLILYCEVWNHPLQSEVVVFAGLVFGLKTAHTVMTKTEDK